MDLAEDESHNLPARSDGHAYQPDTGLTLPVAAIPTTEKPCVA